MNSIRTQAYKFWQANATHSQLERDRELKGKLFVLALHGWKQQGYFWGA